MIGGKHWFFTIALLSLLIKEDLNFKTIHCLHQYHLIERDTKMEYLRAFTFLQYVFNLIKDSTVILSNCMDLKLGWVSLQTLRELFYQIYLNAISYF